MSMKVDESDPRRVDAAKRLAEAQAAREASRPPEEKVAKIRHHIQRITGELTSTATKRLAQEAEYKAICTQLHASQADMQRLEKELQEAQAALKVQETILQQRNPVLKVGPQRSTTPEVTPLSSGSVQNGS